MCQQMDLLQAYHRGFVDGTSRWSQNLTIAAWAIYSLNQTPRLFNGHFMRPTTENQAEYDVVICLLVDAYHLGISTLCIFLDSQLVVSQLNRTFQIHDSFLSQKYLHA